MGLFKIAFASIGLLLASGCMNLYTRWPTTPR